MRLDGIIEKRIVRTTVCIRIMAVTTGFSFCKRLEQKSFWNMTADLCYVSLTYYLITGFPMTWPKINQWNLTTIMAYIYVNICKLWSLSKTSQLPTSARNIKVTRFFSSVPEKRLRGAKMCVVLQWKGSWGQYFGLITRPVSQSSVNSGLAILKKYKNDAKVKGNLVKNWFSEIRNALHLRIRIQSLLMGTI